jgi:phage shock protein E
MKQAKWLILALLVVMLAACGGTAATAVMPQVPAASDAAVAEGALNLPASVDVQTVAQIQGRDDVLLLDVREPWEYEEGHIPNVTLIPMNDIPARLQEIPTDKTVIITCRSGNRSGQVAAFLRQNGFTNVHNMEGGILDWEKAGFAVDR